MSLLLLTPVTHTHSNCVCVCVCVRGGGQLEPYDGAFTKTRRVYGESCSEAWYTLVKPLNTILKYISETHCSNITDIRFDMYIHTVISFLKKLHLWSDMS